MVLVLLLWYIIISALLPFAVSVTVSVIKTTVIIESVLYLCGDIDQFSRKIKYLAAFNAPANKDYCYSFVILSACFLCKEFNHLPSRNRISLVTPLSVAPFV